LKTLSPGVLDLVNFFQKNNFFSVFRKDALRLGSNIFETFRFAPRKISRWKNLFVFQRLMFLYQLVNLVLETCFIFSKTLKLSKTFCLEFLVLFDHSNNERYDSPIPDFWNKNVQENVNSWVFGVLFYKVNCGVHLGFLTHLFQKDV